MKAFTVFIGMVVMMAVPLTASAWRAPYCHPTREIQIDVSQTQSTIFENLGDILFLEVGGNLNDLNDPFEWTVISSVRGLICGQIRVPEIREGEKVQYIENYYPESTRWRREGFLRSSCAGIQDPSCVPNFGSDGYADAIEGWAQANLFVNLHPEFYSAYDFIWHGRDMRETFTLTVQPAPNSRNLHLRLIVPDETADRAGNPYRSSRYRPEASVPIAREVGSLPMKNASRGLRKMVVNNLFSVRHVMFRAPVSQDTYDTCLPKRLWFHLYSLEGRVDTEMTCRLVADGYDTTRVDNITGENEHHMIPPAWNHGLNFILGPTGELFRGPSFNQALYNAPCDEMLMLEIETENGDCGTLEFDYWQGESLPVEAVRQNPAAGIQSGPGLTRPELASDPLEPRQKPQVK